MSHLYRRQIVHTAKCPYGEMADGELSIRRNVLTTKCPCGEMPMRRNVHTAKCPTAKCPTANYPTAKCPRALNTMPDVGSGYPSTE